MTMNFDITEPSIQIPHNLYQDGSELRDLVHQLGTAACSGPPPLCGHQLPQHKDLHRDQAAEEGPEEEGGPDVRGADADSGRVHRVQPAQAPAQPP